MRTKVQEWLSTYTWPMLWAFPEHTLDQSSTEKQKIWESISMQISMVLKSKSKIWNGVRFSWNRKEKEKKNTYNSPEYELGRGATIDLVILFMRPCISCSESKKVKLQMFIIRYLKNGTSSSLLTAAIYIRVSLKISTMVDADKHCFEIIKKLGTYCQRYCPCNLLPSLISKTMHDIDNAT